jgi:transposase
MYFRQKKSGNHTYLQIVQSHRQEGQPRQRVIATLGRLDELTQNAQLESLLASGARFAPGAMLLNAFERGEITSVGKISIGPGLIFERLWQQTGIATVLHELAKGRRHGFLLERAVFLTVVHRLCCAGSDRAADKWRQTVRIEGAQEILLHQLYRAMAWLGEKLSDQTDKTPFAPRCIKDLIEERLFERRRDLFTSLDLVFFDTTSIYFEGNGGETIGQNGHSKDSRPDLKQMVAGVVLDSAGRPILCELMPGNTTDVKTLVPIVTRLQKRFAVANVCIVADRGMISRQTIEEIEAQEWFYILGARMRTTLEVRDEVLSRSGRYQLVHAKGESSKDPSPLKVKEVDVEGRRYIVCLNEDQVKKDAADREAILEGLRRKLAQGDKALVGNQGYRKYLTGGGAGFAIDEQKVKFEARFDGKWVLRTNTSLSTSEVALKYKELWQVEDIFRSMKSILETRPIYHKCDDTIRGHVFCSFLALVLRKALMDQLAQRGDILEWADIVRDLNGLEEIQVDQDNKRFLLRSHTTGVCSKVFQAVGVALPPTVRSASPKGIASA